MTAFATAFHWLWADLRRYRFYLLAFAVLNVAFVIGERAPVPPAVFETVPNLLRVAQMILFPLLVIQGVLGDSVADSRSFWWTRPISAGTLLAVKTAYVGVGLCLPWFISCLGGWIYDGFSGRQILLATAEWTVYMAGAGGLFIGIAASSRSFLRALNAVFEILGVLVLGIWTLNLFDLRRFKPDFWAIPAEMHVFVVFFAFVACGALCLASAVGSRRRFLHHLGLALVGLVPLWMPRTEEAALSVDGPPAAGEPSLVGSAPCPGMTLVRPEAGEPRDATLLRNLGVRDLPDRHFAVPIHSSFTFTGADSKQARFFLSKQLYWLMREIRDGRYAWPMLRGALGEDARLVSGSSGGHFKFSVDVSSDRGLDESIPGHLTGELQYLVYEVVPLGELPMRIGARLVHEGHDLHIARVRDDGDSIELVLRFHQPDLRLSDRLDERTRLIRLTWSTWILVMVFPETGEAEVELQDDSRTLGGPFPISQRGSWRVNFSRPGVARTDEDSVLYAFRVAARGACRSAFDWDQHIVDLQVHERGHRESSDPTATSQSEPVPVESTESLARLVIPVLDLTFQERRDWIQRARTIFSADIPGALARVPWRDPLHEALLEALSAHLTEAHLPAFREALERDPRLVRLIEERGWGDRFKAFVIRQLAARNAGSDEALMRLGAGYRDPALNDDLRWHFVHAEGLRWRDPDGLLKALEAQSGFDTRSAVEEAWDRARFTGQQFRIWIIALDRGLPGAVEYAMKRIHEEGRVSHEGHSGYLRHLRRVTRFTGSIDAFYAWLERNAADLVFDPVDGKYRLPD